MTTALLTESVAKATKRRRTYPLARILSDGRISVRIAANCWTNPSDWLHVSLFRLLPKWQQEAFLRDANPEFKGDFVRLRAV